MKPQSFTNLSPLDKFIRYRRIRSVMAYIPLGSRILDFGCGEDGAFLGYLQSRLRLGPGVGIDPIALEGVRENRELRKGSLERIRPDEKFDVVTMLAVLEHLNDPLATLVRLRQVLKPQGRIVLTVPSVWSRPVLEFLAFRLGVISDFGVRDHKMYYDRNLLLDILRKAGFENIQHRYFQFWMNNLVVAETSAKDLSR